MKMVIYRKGNYSGCLDCSLLGLRKEILCFAIDKNRSFIGQYKRSELCMISHISSSLFS